MHRFFNVMDSHNGSTILHRHQRSGQTGTQSVGWYWLNTIVSQDLS
jgi:hypothetical protein